MSKKPSEFLIIAASDSTQIDITPSYNTMGGRTSGSTFSITLNQGEAYQVQSKVGSSGDMTGSYVKGNKNFALFAGDSWTKVVNCGNQDNLYEQMYAISKWGKEYISVRTQGRLNPYDVVRIMAAKDSTGIYIDGALTTTLNAGKYYEFQNYNDIPHLLCPVIFDAQKTINALQWLTREMERRFEVFSEIPTRNLSTYKPIIGNNLI